MEQEYKWDLPSDKTREQLLAHVASVLQEHETLEMEAVYYDTEDLLMTGMKGAVRLRKENGDRVCCMKLPLSDMGACTLREEYEVSAPDVETGLRKLPESGAPAELCQKVLKQGVTELCRIDYRREAYRLEAGNGEERFRGELTMDVGEGRKGDRVVPIAEIEFEFRESDGGSREAFHSFALALEEEFLLRPQRRSKLARVMDL